MLANLRPPRVCPNRTSTAAFTLVELLVVIAIIGTLVALLLPAIHNSRAVVRQLECSNHLRNLGLAIINLTTTKPRGPLPGYLEPIERNDKQFAAWAGIGGNPPELAHSKYANTNSRTASRVSWAARLLPQIERQDVWDRIVDGRKFPDRDADNIIIPIAIFVCPDDEATTTPDNAALTYIANTGGWDWRLTTGPFNDSAFLASLSSSAAPQGDTNSNGLFQNRVFGKRNNRLDDVGDGASTTLMFSENVHKNSRYSWFGVDGRDVTAQAGEQHFGMVWVSSLAPQAGTSATNQEPFSSDSSPIFAPGEYPDYGPWYCRPAANHPAGSFNVVFVDGHGDSLEPGLDYLVYQQLLTTKGDRCVDSADNRAFLAVGQPVHTFQTAPPLSERDY
jgi:prepilin-type N-terminal cleavage/methylation domain-containing protein/prepilin-type processing-associated H-X9-DG protein